MTVKKSDRWSARTDEHAYAQEQVDTGANSLTERGREKILGQTDGQNRQSEQANRTDRQNTHVK